VGHLLARFRAWRGEPLRWRGEVVWLLDEVLDRIPRYEDHRWYRYGHWGCTLGLRRYWDRDEHRLAPLAQVDRATAL